MAKRKASPGSRSTKSKDKSTKREHWGKHYNVVTRDKNNKIIQRERWHPPMEFPAKVLADGRRIDVGGYKYMVRARDEHGQVRSLTVTSNKRYSMKNSYQRKMLKKAVKEKYETLEDEKGKKYRFEIARMRFRWTMNLGTGQRWV